MEKRESKNLVGLPLQLDLVAGYQMMSFLEIFGNFRPHARISFIQILDISLLWIAERLLFAEI